MPRSVSPSRWQRIAWFALLWLGGVATVTAVSYALRAIMKATLT